MLREIKSKCVLQGISIKDLAIKSNIAPTSIYFWDRRTPSVDKVLKVAKILNCTVEELCKDERFN